MSPTSSESWASALKVRLSRFRPSTNRLRPAPPRVMDETTNSAGDHYSTLQAFMGVKS